MAGAKRGVFLPFANVMPGWDVVTERLNAALEPLGAISQRSTAHPPTIAAGVDALLHLHRAAA